MRPGILLRLSFDLFSIGLIKESRELGAKLREMIEQLCVGKIVRSRNARMLLDRSDPGVENLVPVGEYKVTKIGDCSDRRPPLTVMSDECSPS
jgi:hypothetical protein